MNIETRYDSEMSDDDVQYTNMDINSVYHYPESADHYSLYNDNNDNANYSDESDDEFNETNNSDEFNETNNPDEFNETNNSDEFNETNNPDEFNETNNSDEFNETNNSDEFNETSRYSNSNEFNEYIIGDDIDPDPEKITKQTEQDNNQSNTKTDLTNGRKKRGLPKSVLANQQKYLEALEKQQRMMNANKKNGKQNNDKKKKNKNDLDTQETPRKTAVSAIPVGTRRVIVAGRVKYIPIKTDVDSTISNKTEIDSKIPNKIEIDRKNSNKTGIDRKISNKTEIDMSISNKNNENTENYIPIFKKVQKRDFNKDPLREGSENQILDQNKAAENITQVNSIKPTIEPSVKIHVKPAHKPITLCNRPTNLPNKSSNSMNKSSNPMNKSSNPMNKSSNSMNNSMNKSPNSMNNSTTTRNLQKKDNNNSCAAGRRIPSKYAKQIENDVKKQTVKNAKNFTDLRRIRALQDIAPNTEIDVNKASIIELRKLRIEQRKREQAEQKKKCESNKRESAIQGILTNDKMTKFGKAIAIKNLSVNSRTKRIAAK